MMKSQRAIFVFQIRSPQGSLQKTLTAAQVTVGRSPDCELFLDNQKISRRHLRVGVVDGKIVVEDLGSSNGTVMNGMVLLASHPVPLPPVAHLELVDADTWIEVRSRLEGEPASPEDSDDEEDPAAFAETVIFTRPIGESIPAGSAVEAAPAAPVADKAEKKAAVSGAPADVPPSRWVSSSSPKSSVGTVSPRPASPVPASKISLEPSREAEAILAEARRKAMDITHDAESAAERSTHEALEAAHQTQERAEEFYRARVQEALREGEQIVAKAERDAHELLQKTRQQNHQLRLDAERFSTDTRARAEERATQLLIETEATARSLKEQRLKEVETAGRALADEIVQESHRQFETEVAERKKSLQQEIEDQAARLKAQSDAQADRLRNESKIHDERIRAESAAQDDRLREEARAHEEKLQSERKSQEDRLLAESKDQSERLQRESVEQAARLLEARTAHDSKIEAERREHEDRLRSERSEHDDRLRSEAQTHQEKIEAELNALEQRLRTDVETHNQRLRLESEMHERRLRTELETHQTRVQAEARVHEARLTSERASHEAQLQAENAERNERVVREMQAHRDRLEKEEREQTERLARDRAEFEAWRQAERGRIEAELVNQRRELGSLATQVEASGQEVKAALKDRDEALRVLAEARATTDEERKRQNEVRAEQTAMEQRVRQLEDEDRRLRAEHEKNRQEAADLSRQMSQWREDGQRERKAFETLQSQLRSKAEDARVRAAKEEENQLHQLKLETTRRAQVFERELFDDVRKRQEQISRQITLLVESSVRAVPQGKNWDPAAEDIEGQISRIVAGETVTAVQGTVAKAKRSSLLSEKRRERLQLAMLSALGGAVVLFGLERGYQIVRENQTPMQQQLASLQAERAREMAARKYDPPRDAQVRDSYVDCVVSTRGFREMYANDELVQKWTKEATLYLLKTWRLPEDQSIQAVAIAASLVRELAEKKDKINPDFIPQGLEKMRVTEHDAVTRLKETLGGEVRLESFRKLEKQFFEANQVEINALVK